MTSVRSMLLERRPDLPLCSLRQMRQLRSDRRMVTSAGKDDRKKAFREMREVLTSKSLQKAERDMRFLLEVPVKVGRSCARLGFPVHSCPVHLLRRAVANSALCRFVQPALSREEQCMLKGIYAFQSVPACAVFSCP